MIRDIFGGIVPSFDDAIVSLFLPQGFFILLNLILISAGSGLLFISRLLYNRTELGGQTPHRRMGLEWLLLFLIGLFITILLTIILVAFLLLSISYLLKVKNDRKKSNKGTLVLLLLNIIIFIAVSIGGLLFAFLLGWWVYGWMLQIGVIFGAILVIAKKLFKLKIFEKNSVMSKKSKIALKVSSLSISVLFCSVFVISLIPNTRLTVPDGPTSGVSTNLTIMTYNIRLGTGNEEDSANQWFTRKEKFVEYLDSFNLDVFGIQEAQYFQIQFIYENLESREYVWTGRARNNGIYDGEACAIFYDSEKFEFIDGDTFWLSDIPDYPSNTFGGSNNRVVTWVRLEVTTGESKGAQFVVFNTHYDFANEWQIKASNLLMERMTLYSGGLPTFIMGDFNLRNESIAFPILENYNDPGENKPMWDAYRVYQVDQIGYLPYATTSPKDWDVRKDPEDKSRIDFIFISNNINVSQCTIPKDSYDGYRTYSDHYPVYMNCTF